MVVDSSAVLAILLHEKESELLLAKLQETPEPAVIPAPILLEILMVVGSRLPADAWELVHRFLVESGIQIGTFTNRHAEVAFEGFLKYGKGRHPAALNFADCMAYSYAKVTGEALLFVGEDFKKTDVQRA